jgi:D-alanyl-D-alanine dipeptidase
MIETRTWSIVASRFFVVPLVVAMLFGCARGVDAPPAPTAAELAAEGLVPLTDVDPRIVVDLRYASTRNFVGVVLYSSDVPLLRQSVAERLKRANDRLAATGHRLVVWDAYRPLSVQQRLFDLVPDERYVANPQKGSRHNRGAAVDVTLADTHGRALPMPTDFDDFSERAHRVSLGGGAVERANYDILHAAMTAEGFVGLATEWWHYDDPAWESYPIVGR